MKLKSVIVVALLIVTSACTLGWGRSFTRVDSSPDFVKYKYFLASVDEGGMNKEARDYCNVYQKDAVLQNRVVVPGGANDEFVNTYVCTQPIIYAPAIPEETR